MRQVNKQSNNGQEEPKDPNGPFLVLSNEHEMNGSIIAAEKESS